MSMFDKLDGFEPKTTRRIALFIHLIRAQMKLNRNIIDTIIGIVFKVEQTTHITHRVDTMQKRYAHTNTKQKSKPQVAN